MYRSFFPRCMAYLFENRNNHHGSSGTHRPLPAITCDFIRFPLWPIPANEE